MSGKSSKQRRKSRLRSAGDAANPSTYRHGWQTVGGLRFIVIRQGSVFMGAFSEADHVVQALVSGANVSLEQGEDTYGRADLVHRTQALLDEFSPERNTDQFWDSLSADQYQEAAVMLGVALIAELEKRAAEGFHWETPVERVVERRLMNDYGLNGTETRVVRRNGGVAA